MKRYCVCDRIGTGTHEDPYRPAVADHPGVSKATEMAIGSATKVICLMSGPDLTGPLADSRVDAFQDISLDSPLSLLTAQQFNALVNKLEARGFTVTVSRATHTFRDLLTEVGVQCNPSFDTNRFDVS